MTTRIRNFVTSLLLCAGVIGIPWHDARAQSDPAIVGQWSAVQTWPYRAVHTTLLPTGKVLFFSYYAESLAPQIWDPTTNAITPASPPSYQIFCAGHSLLSDGRILVAGGHQADYVGFANASIYTPLTDSWTPAPNMNDGRWYPTSTTLANGDVLVFGGDVDAITGVDALPQVWQAATGIWRDLTTAQLVLPLYSRLFLAPNGKVFEAGSDRLTRYLDTTGTGAWSAVGNTVFTGSRDYGAVVMYDVGKVLTVGGSDPPTNSAEVIDLNSATPAWKSVGSMSFPRRQHNATVLPDGKVLITGGSTGSGNDNSAAPVYSAEMWDPAAGAFTVMAANSVYRGYHSTALLLPDGRVVSAGGNVGGPTAEIYSPPYLFNGARPTIASAPSSVSYGQTFSIATPDAANIAQVTWIRLGSVTHSFDMNQRFMRLSFSPTTGTLNVTAPSNPNIAPPGHYMMFILLGNGVPSTATIMQIGPINTGPPVAAGTIVGHVSNSSGVALSGAIVAYGGGSTSTDASGNYTLPNVPAGNVQVTASLSGYQNSTQTVSVTSGTSSTANFALSAAVTPGLVKGVVTKLSNGQALGGATVKYSGGSALTNNTGNYTFVSVAPGTYNFTASANGYLSRTNSVTVTAGATSTSNFQLATGGKIGGTVTGATGAVVSGATVKMSGGVIATTITLTTNTSGAYVTNWVPVGSYTVTVSKTGHVTQSKTTTVSSGIKSTVNFTSF